MFIYCLQHACAIMACPDVNDVVADNVTKLYDMSPLYFPYLHTVNDFSSLSIILLYPLFTFLLLSVTYIPSFSHLYSFFIQLFFFIHIFILSFEIFHAILSIVYQVSFPTCSFYFNSPTLSSRTWKFPGNLRDVFMLMMFVFMS